MRRGRGTGGQLGNSDMVCGLANGRANAVISICSHGCVRCGHWGELGKGQWGHPVLSLQLGNCQDHLSKVLLTHLHWVQLEPLGSAWLGLASAQGHM